MKRKITALKKKLFFNYTRLTKSKLLKKRAYHPFWPKFYSKFSEVTRIFNLFFVKRKI